MANISLDINDGDFIGLTGSNGAGKTTLLRVIAGIIPADAGEIYTHCSITPFISNLWSSSSSSLTARDQARKAYFTLSTTRPLPSYEEYFSLILQNSLLSEDVLHLPVSSLSRGMRTRLGFGISTALRSDVMVIDEGLGTGDKKFQRHAKKVLESIRSSCKALVLATHSKSLMKELCHTTIMLDSGKIQDSHHIA